MHWLIACVHLHAVVDRIEPPFVVVEWTHTGQLGDVPFQWVPLHTREGDRLVVHIRTAKHKSRSVGMRRHHSTPPKQSNGVTFETPQEEVWTQTQLQQWQRLLGAPTRIFTGADKGRHESKTSKQWVGVSLSEEED